MKTIKDVQAEVRRINLEVLRHNNATPDEVGETIMALNELTCAIEPLAAEASDLLALEEAFQPCGSMGKADDPGMVWVRFPRVEFETMRAMAESIQTRRRLRKLVPIPLDFQVPDGAAGRTFRVVTMVGWVPEWSIDGEPVHRGEEFVMPPDASGRRVTVKMVAAA